MKKIIKGDVKYEPVNNLIQEVKLELHSYFDSNMVDEAIFPSVIRKCLEKIRWDHRPVMWDVIEIDCGKGDLPKNFDKLCLALGCFDCTVVTKRPGIHTQEYHVCELDLCQTSCDVCHDECGNMYQIVQKFEEYSTSYRKFELLNPTGHMRPHCVDNCFNFASQSKNEICVVDGKLETNFEKGLVYIEYVAKLEDENGYLVPEKQAIQEWIKAELIHKTVQVLYWNGEPDILQRYKDIKADLAIKAENAKVIYKANEYQDFYGLYNRLIRRYNRIRLNIFDNNCTIDYSRRF